MTTKTKKPRTPKFGHLKVGDEVVIEDSRGERRIETVSSIDGYRGVFYIDRGRNVSPQYTIATGKGKKTAWHQGGDMAVIVTDEELQAVHDEMDKRRLAAELSWSRSNWNSLTLDQLRRIKFELDAAQKGATT